MNKRRYSMKKIYRNIIVLIAVIVLLSTNVFTKQHTNQHVNPINEPVQYTQISYDDIEGIPYISKWYQKNYKKEGLHFGTYKEKVYILISAGERPTNGYSIILSELKRISRGAIYISAGVMSPSSRKKVTQAVTYPNMLIKINDSRIIRTEGTINALKDDKE